jgi:hypothetical protein
MAGLIGGRSSCVNNTNCEAPWKWPFEVTGCPDWRPLYLCRRPSKYSQSDWKTYVAAEYGSGVTECCQESCDMVGGRSSLIQVLISAILACGLLCSGRPGYVSKFVIHSDPAQKLVSLM